METLPSYVNVLFEGYAQRRESALLRTDMEYGPPKQAKIKSLVMITRQASFHLASRIDFQSFEDWYRDDINEGASWFFMNDPVSNTQITARFVGGGYNATPMTADLENWKIAVEIESWIN
jgi:hypothetical protein